MVTNTCIGRLTVHGGQHDTHTRLRMSHLLSSADIRPSTLSPTAVFLVRRLTDPLPGQMAVDGAVRVRTQWETAVRHSLARQVSQAVRPQQGRLPPVADAVLFIDEAEMLACFTLALHRGIVHQRWWWRRLLRQVGNQAVSSLWQERPYQLPAIFHFLSRWHETGPVLTTLSAAETAAILKTVAKAHVVPDLQVERERPFISPPETRSPKPDLIEQHQNHSPTAAPWAAWVHAAEMPDQLTAAQTLLLGVGLMLHRRPTAVATPAFAESVHRWQQAQQSNSTLASTNDSGGRNPTKSGSGVIHPQAKAESGMVGLAQTAVTSKSDASLPKSPDAQPKIDPRQDRVDTPDVSTLNEHPLPTESRLEDITLEPKSQGAWSQTFAEGVETQLGGIFYVCNVMQLLNLPDCFDPSFALTQQVGPWGTLEVLARALLGERHQSLHADPVWKALAMLDNRSPTQLPGISFRLPDKTTLPPAWISDTTWPTFKQADLAKRPFLQGVNPFLLQWLVLVLPRISHHLHTVLHLDEPISLSHLGQTVLVLNGRLFVTPTHVDLVFRLDDISLPMRLAGLDIDPGWTPSLGRVVQFHFQ